MNSQLLVWAKKIADVTPFQKWPQQSDYSARWAAGDGQEESRLAKPASGVVASVRRAVGKFVPASIKAQLAWRGHLQAAKRGLIELDKLQ